VTLLVVMGDVLQKPVEIVGLTVGWVAMHGWLRGFWVLARGGTKEEAAKEATFVSVLMSPSGLLFGVCVAIYAYSS
jgi:hypothetical protein